MGTEKDPRQGNMTFLTSVLSPPEGKERKKPSPSLPTQMPGAIQGRGRVSSVKARGGLSRRTPWGGPEGARVPIIGGVRGLLVILGHLGQGFKERVHGYGGPGYSGVLRGLQDGTWRCWAQTGVRHTQGKGSEPLPHPWMGLNSNLPATCVSSLTPALQPQPCQAPGRGGAHWPRAAWHRAGAGQRESWRQIPQAPPAGQKARAPAPGRAWRERICGSRPSRQVQAHLGEGANDELGVTRATQPPNDGSNEASGSGGTVPVLAQAGSTWHQWAQVGKGLHAGYLPPAPLPARRPLCGSVHPEACARLTPEPTASGFRGRSQCRPEHRERGMEPGGREAENCSPAQKSKSLRESPGGGGGSRGGPGQPLSAAGGLQAAGADLGCR